MNKYKSDIASVLIYKTYILKKKKKKKRNMLVSHLHLMEMWGKVRKVWDRVQVSRILRYTNPKNILLQNMPFLDTPKYSSKHFRKLIFAMTFSWTSDVSIPFLHSKTEDTESHGLWKQFEVIGCELMWVSWALEGTAPCSDKNVRNPEQPVREPSLAARHVRHLLTFSCRPWTVNAV